MARKRTNQSRASDRLNVALARISAAAELVDQFEPGADKQTAATVLRKQLTEAIDEAHAALVDIRHAAGAI